MNVLYCYKVGIHDNFTYKEKSKPMMIAIGGDSGAGKTRLAGVLAHLFSKENVESICGDDAHRWPRGHQNWEVFTHLDPKGSQLHREHEHALALKSGHPIERVQYDHGTGKFSNPVQVEPNKVIIFEGLLPYYLKRTRDLFDLKIFVDPDERLRRRWKIDRDVKERGHDKEKVEKQLDDREEDAEKYVKSQKILSDIILSYQNAGRLNITVGNSIEIEPLAQSLVAVNSFDLEYIYDDDDMLTLKCSGKVSAKELEKAAYEIIQNVRELTQTVPSWKPDLEGFTQLFVLYYLSEMSRSKD